ncbi:DNA-directed RNA polymerases I and III subunit RPAC1, putative [Entamoeba dispar SAW760]|uniref:DNA-directed RNA polymerases I and III subunit RPAC1, putative n=1 Tax=Entamoeba dispar (strain ATCC PRA-260 / SAW760) TaxID=370354 RepID=B0EJB9_ENTDS|nr:DNA-directed RNA polymerases I and III subunit RPAC1, putative [Entamoeba dispar SAW760]EDR25427.1 DNA-directed RNA polymerases I and III subunit RPAC1, putative [Entamoeba dispar SAW760]|eukprot:EDR25427.1 DNA-directed RNA polymerases I and III subunit RPAC1, putative [Entamoeba dispar SAW760]
MECQPRIIKISESPEKVEFDAMGIDVSVANGLRRIMIAEVPTMAIEMVVLEDNSSAIPDEMLCHRLGLIPILADPRKFKFPKDRHFTDPTEEDTIVFTLDVTCTLDSAKNPVNNKVYSSDLIWEPQGEQETTFADCPIKPVFDDILIAELQPHQHIKCKLFCCKGIGQDHAKFSPVCPATYRLMPKITVIKQNKKMSKEIKNCCPLNVFDIEDGELIVKNPRNCKMCRECIREERSEYIKLGREENHYLFSVESTGIYPAKEIFSEAVKIMKSKAEKLVTELENRKQQQND